MRCTSPMDDGVRQCVLVTRCGNAVVFHDVHRRSVRMLLICSSKVPSDLQAMDLEHHS